MAEIVLELSKTKNANCVFMLLQGRPETFDAAAAAAVMSCNSDADVSDAALLGRDGMYSQQLLSSQVESLPCSNKDEVASASSGSYDMARLDLDSDSGSSSYVRGVVNSLTSDMLRPTAGSPTKLSQEDDDDVDDEVAETAESGLQDYVD